MAMISLRELIVGGRPARVYVGGEGTPVLLLHGAWGGAEMHWSTVWGQLAERHTVIAPDLPGLAASTPAGPRAADGFVAWLEEMLGALGTGPAFFVGNSFGALVASRLAARAPARCLGLCFVNGLPVGGLPWLVRSVLGLPGFRHALRALWRRGAFHPSTLPRAFVDPSLAPAELCAVLQSPSSAQPDLLVDVILGGGPPVPPWPGRALVIWGEGDGTFGSRIGDARRYLRRIPGLRLVPIPRAGHLPQVERPEEFVTALTDFIDRS